MQKRRPASAGRLGDRQREKDKAAGRPELIGFSNFQFAESEWSRAQVNGCVKTPKLRSDEAKLKELFICCRAANYREVRAVAFHYPYLLALTDSNGFTALHHAEMSGNAEFMAKLLDLYNDPRSFTRKFVKYYCEEDLRSDGIQLFSNRSSTLSQQAPVTNTSRPSSRQSHHSLPSTQVDGDVVVRNVAAFSIAADAGVVPGDTLEAVEGAPLNAVHRIMLTPEDIAEVISNGARLEDGYPLILEFNGPATAEILGRDSWTPLHAAAGGGAHYKQVARLLHAERSKVPPVAKDAHGCTPEHWALMNKRTCVGPKRRPLRTGSCPRLQKAGSCSRSVTMAQDEERARVLAMPQRLPRAPPPPSSP